jgi:peptidoglycan-associated lipoprotein
MQYVFYNTTLRPIFQGDVMRALAISAILLLTLVGCSGNKTKPTASPEAMDTSAQTADTSSATQEAPAASTSEASTSNVSGNPLTDPANILSHRKVYFDFDDYSIKAYYKDLIEAHAKYLVNNPSAKVTLEGHADERGTREYNLALGQKRATAVKQMMNLLGANDSQIETVSYGEEKPASAGTGEYSWSLNRRVEIRYLGE